MSGVVEYGVRGTSLLDTINWEAKHTGLKPALFERQQVVRTAGKVCAVFAVASVGAVAYTALALTATPVIVLTAFSASVVLTVALGVASYIALRKHDYWQDPEFRRERGKFVAYEIESQNLGYDQIQDRYGNEIRQYAILNDQDLRSLLEADLAVLGYQTFIGKHTTRAFSRLTDQGLDILRGKFFDEVVLTVSYDYLVGNYAEVLDRLRISQEMLVERYTYYLTQLTYNDFASGYGENALNLIPTRDDILGYRFTVGCKGSYATFVEREGAGVLGILGDVLRETVKQAFLYQVAGPGFTGLVDMGSRYSYEFQALGVVDTDFAKEIVAGAKTIETYQQFIKINGKGVLRFLPTEVKDRFNGALLMNFVKSGVSFLTAVRASVNMEAVLSAQEIAKIILPEELRRCSCYREYVERNGEESLAFLNDEQREQVKGWFLSHLSDDSEGLVKDRNTYAAIISHLGLKFEDYVRNIVLPEADKYIFSAFWRRNGEDGLRCALSEKKDVLQRNFLIMSYGEMVHPAYEAARGLLGVDRNVIAGVINKKAGSSTYLEFIEVHGTAPIEAGIVDRAHVVRYKADVLASLQGKSFAEILRCEYLTVLGITKEDISNILLQDALHNSGGYREFVRKHGTDPITGGYLTEPLRELLSGYFHAIVLTIDTEVELFSFDSAVLNALGWNQKMLFRQCWEGKHNFADIYGMGLCRSVREGILSVQEAYSEFVRPALPRIDLLHLVRNYKELFTRGIVTSGTVVGDQTLKERFSFAVHNMDWKSMLDTFTPVMIEFGLVDDKILKGQLISYLSCKRDYHSDPLAACVLSKGDVLEAPALSFGLMDKFGISSLLGKARREISDDEAYVERQKSLLYSQYNQLRSGVEQFSRSLLDGARKRFNSDKQGLQRQIREKEQGRDVSLRALRAEGETSKKAIEASVVLFRCVLSDSQALQKLLDDRKVELQRLGSDLSEKTTIRETHLARVSRFPEEQAAIAASVSKLEIEIAESQGERQREVTGVFAAVGALARASEGEGKQRDLHRLQKRLKSIPAEVDSETRKARDCESRIKVLAAACESKRQEISSLGHRLQGLESQVIEAKSVLAKHDERLSQLASSLRGREGEIERSCSAEIKPLQVQIDRLTRDFASFEFDHKRKLESRLEESRIQERTALSLVKVNIARHHRNFMQAMADLAVS